MLIIKEDVPKTTKLRESQFPANFFIEPIAKLVGKLARKIMVQYRSQGVYWNAYAIASVANGIGCELRISKKDGEDSIYKFSGEKISAYGVGDDRPARIFYYNRSRRSHA